MKQSVIDATRGYDHWEREITCGLCGTYLHEDTVSEYGQGDLGRCRDCRDSYACEYCDGVFDGEPRQSQFGMHLGGKPFELCPRCYAEEAEEHE